MKQFVNAYAPVNHAALPCPIREAAKVWAVLTEAGSGATAAEKRAALVAYHAAKKSAGIDEDWTPAKGAVKTRGDAAPRWPLSVNKAYVKPG